MNYQHEAHARIAIQNKPTAQVPDDIDYDPLDQDCSTDPIRVLSQRHLNRLIYVAAEAGAHIGSLKVPGDPATWMFVPRRLFNGESAIEACRERDAFTRAILLHMSQAGLDADPDKMDDLIGGEWGTLTADGEPPISRTKVEACGTMAPPGEFSLAASALYTTSIVSETPEHTAHIFAAFVETSEEAARDKLRLRLGSQVAEGAEFFHGFDPSNPVGASLVSECMADILADVDRDATTTLAAGLEHVVEHRFTN